MVDPEYTGPSGLGSVDMVVVGMLAPGLVVLLVGAPGLSGMGSAVVVVAPGPGHREGPNFPLLLELSPQLAMVEGVLAIAFLAPLPVPHPSGTLPACLSTPASPLTLVLPLAPRSLSTPVGGVPPGWAPLVPDSSWAIAGTPMLAHHDCSTKPAYLAPIRLGLAHLSLPGCCWPGPGS